MASEARIAANRRNAAKSTGPRTLVGKAIVAQNALKHGLFAQQGLIAWEDPQQYQEHCRRFLAELNPSGERQGLLAGRIVSLAWRLKRAERLQNELFEFLLAREIESSLSGFADEMSEQDIERMRRKTETNPAYAVGRMLAWDYRGEKTLDKLSLHEQRIEGSLYRTMKELDRVQAARAILECGIEAESAKQSQLAGVGGQGPGVKGAEDEFCETKPIDGWQRREGPSELADDVTPPESHRQAALAAATQTEVVGGSAEQSQSAAVEGGQCQPCETATQTGVGSESVEQSQSVGVGGRIV